MTHRKQHIVPVVYLKHFCCDVEGRFLYCLYLNSSSTPRIIKVGPKHKLFTRRKYYSEQSLQEPNSIERAFAEHIEPTYNNIINAIDSRSISTNCRELILQWLFISQMRTPSLRENVQRVMIEYLRIASKMKEQYEPEMEKSIFNYASRSAKQIQLNQFSPERLNEMIPAFYEPVMAKKWRILISRRDFPFITNDSPGFSPNLDPRFAQERPFHMVMEINSSSEIYYVLSPRYCLHIYPFSHNTPIRYNAMNTDIKFEETSDFQIELINQGVLSTRNRVVVSNSESLLERYIYLNKK